jgi:hypothetical protein
VKVLIIVVSLLIIEIDVIFDCDSLTLIGGRFGACYSEINLVPCLNDTDKVVI